MAPNVVDGKTNVFSKVKQRTRAHLTDQCAVDRFPKRIFSLSTCLILFLLFKGVFSPAAYGFEVS